MGEFTFRNYLAVAIRSLSRNRLYSLINILGLSLGITLYVMDELSYDRYHEKADRIYRVIMDARLMGKEIKGAVSPAPMAKVLVDEIPDVVSAVRLWKRTDVLVGTEDQKFTADVFYADGTQFSHTLCSRETRARRCKNRIRSFSRDPLRQSISGSNQQSGNH
jgi:putative ABC transport system permease protein